jgi:hypothetical protein
VADAVDEHSAWVVTGVMAAIDATPLYVDVLDPRPDVVAAREAGRAKTGYGDWSIPKLSAALRAETRRVGLWLDSSDLTAEATVDAILRRHHEAQIR